MELEFDRSRWSNDSEGFWLSLRVREPQAARQFVGGMADKPYIAELREKRGKRSLDANAYLWVLCQKIAEAVGNITKDDVYRRAVHEVGQFEILPIRVEALDAFIRKWHGHGTGWIAEKQDDSKLPGYVRVIAYYGSSVYDTQEMSVLLNYIIDEAKQLNIETATPDELALMKARWEDAQANKSG